jgi:hypothetical protein
MRNSVYMQRVLSISDALLSILNEEIKLSALRFPRDIERIIVCGLEIPVVRKPNLTLHSSSQYLCALRGGTYAPNERLTDRPLYGLLHVGPPCSIIFIREDLPPHIRNYVLAHELGHFLADVFFVQQLWMKTLPEQKESIQRAFTWNSYDADLDLRGILKGLPRRPRPIVGRGQYLAPETTDREIHADLFAREIIAPWDEVAPIFRPNQRGEFISLLRQNFGLPLKIGAYYYDDLQRVHAPQPDLIDRLFSSFLSPATEEN